MLIYVRHHFFRIFYDGVFLVVLNPFVANYYVVFTRALLVLL